MFDCIKTRTNNPQTFQRILNCRLVEFRQEFNPRTGEIRDDRYIGEYGGLKIKLYKHSKLVFISGSLHRLYNLIIGGISPGGRAMNHDNFNHYKMSYIVEFLESRFGIVPEETIINTLEYGFNIPVPFPVTDVLRCFIAYKKHGFNKMKTIGKGDGIECYLSQYGIKIYDKGLHYNLDESILRFEIKAARMQSVFKKKILLVDLLEPSLWHHCAASLQKALSSCIITDQMDRKDMLSKDEVLVDRCENPRNWVTFSRKERSLNKKTFDELVKKYGKYQLKNYMLQKFEDELTQMLDV